MEQSVQRKIVEPRQLAERLRELHASGKTTVQCHGCFDIVHPGHVRYLQFARRLGDVLVVSLTGDAAMGKGPGRPYIPQELRAESLAALEFVDWVVIDPHPTACRLLELLRPDVYVKGREYATVTDPRFVREREIVEGYGGRVVFHSGDVVFSSTHLMENRGRDEPLEECRLRAFCQRNAIDEVSLQETLEGFAGVRVLVVGDLIRERYIYCDASEAAGDAPVLSLQRLGSTEYWGGAAAVALQLRALGAQPYVLAAAGRDEPSRQLADDLAKLGIQNHLLPNRPNLLERCTFVADDAKLFKLIEGVCAPLDSAWEKQAATALRQQLAQVQLLIWCDHGFGMITPGLLRAVVTNGRRHTVTVAGHAPGQRAEIGALHAADLVSLTERQLREAMHDMGSGLPAVAWNLLNYTRGRAMIVSLRRRGLIGFDRRHTDAGSPPEPERLKSEFVPSFATHYLDWAGAEEAVLSTAALACATGRSLPKAAYVAAAAEAHPLSQPRIEPVMLDKLYTWFAKRPELRPDSRFYPDAATLGDIARLAPPLVTEKTP